METKFKPDESWKLEIIRFFKGELNSSEEQRLRHWVNENPAHLSYFEEMREAWLTSVTFVSECSQLDAKWAQINKRLITDVNRQLSAIPKSSSVFLSFKRVSAIAAILLIGMIIGVVFSKLVLSGKKQADNEVCEIITPLGAKSNIILPDGTQVWLNAGSKLTYKKSFNTRDRLVTLQGEAFFHVKTNKSKPFVVQTARLNVKALGTSFNVKAYPEDKSIMATLVEGVIQVDGYGENAKPFSVILKPNETITLKGKYFGVAGSEGPKTNPLGLSPEKEINMEADVSIHENVNTEKFTSWKDPQWQIMAENLDDLAVLLGRRFNVSIVKKSTNLKDYRFTGTLQNETLEQVLEILRLTTPLKYKIGKGEVLLDIDSLQQDDYSKILVKKNIRK
jgi:transmembrane sensor